MDTPEISGTSPAVPPEANNEAIPTTQQPSSFLDSIIASTKDEATHTQTANPDWGTWGGQVWQTGKPKLNSGTPTPPKKPREPMPPGMILKAIGALFFVAIIFFGSFLAYIVFNPDQAYFFVNVFGINPNDLAGVLKKLINGSFWIIILVLSVVWIISLFRAIWAPKELKRKRLFGWMTAILVGIILFGILTFWAYLFTVIKTINFPNLDWSVTIYDNALYNNKSTKGESQIQSTNNLIGPITLKFDISENAKQVETKNFIQISSYSIDFDGAKCNDGWSSIVTGSNPREEKWIVCTFDSIKNYNINGSYKWVDRLWSGITIPMNLTPVEIRWVLVVKEQKNKDDKTIITLDASSLKTLGTPRWQYKNDNNILSQDSITEEPTTTPIIVYFSLFGNSVDRIFVLQSTEKKAIWGTLTLIQDPVDPLSFQFQISDLTINPNLILKIEWSLDDGSLICRHNTELCEYTFSTYGKRKIKAIVFLASGENFTLEKDVSVDEPLLLTRHALVTDDAGKVLNTPDTYDIKLRTYLLQNVIPPATLTFDARDIVIENLWYRLLDVIWTFSDGKNTEEKRWEKVTFDINNTLRYTVNATYTFAKNTTTGSGDLKTWHDAITIDVEHKELIPKLFIQTTSDYTPARVTVDGSQSKSEHWEIIKFIYDFWDGKPPATGDAIQEYEYTTPGNKEITLTIIDNNGNTASVKKVVVLKEAPKVVDFATSLSPWTINSPVDFSATNSNGQIDDYIWSFGDNTPTLHGYSVSHTFTDAWTYDISLTIIYSDGTRKSTSKKFIVVSTLQ